MAVLDEMATFIASACSLTVGATLFKGKLPATPDTCAAIYEYAGVGPDFVMGTAAISLEYPRVQIAFRGAKDDYSTPRTTAETAFRACAAAAPQSISSTRYLRMTPLQSPFQRERDDLGRVVIAFNVQLEKELSA